MVPKPRPEELRELLESLLSILRCRIDNLHTFLA